METGATPVLRWSGVSCLFVLFRGEEGQRASAVNLLGTRVSHFARRWRQAQRLFYVNLVGCPGLVAEATKTLV
jgi:hypothetical protein